MGIAGGFTKGVTNFGIAPGGSVPPGIAAIASSTPNSFSVYRVNTPTLLNFRNVRRVIICYLLSLVLSDTTFLGALIRVNDLSSRIAL